MYPCRVSGRIPGFQCVTLILAHFWCSFLHPVQLAEVSFGLHAKCVFMSLTFAFTYSCNISTLKLSKGVRWPSKLTLLQQTLRIWTWKKPHHAQFNTRVASAYVYAYIVLIWQVYLLRTVRSLLFCVTRKARMSCPSTRGHGVMHVASHCGQGCVTSTLTPSVR